MEDTTVNAIPEVRTKFCKYCGGKIHEDAVLCLHCGRQVEEVKKAEQPNIVINNSNQNVNSNTNIAGMYGGRLKNKWISFFLCRFLCICGCEGVLALYIFVGVIGSEGAFCLLC